MKHVQELAREALDNLVRKPKPGIDVEPGDYVEHSDTMVVTRDGAPQWVSDMCMEAHGDMMPDDNRYEFIQAALYLIADAEEYDDARDMIEADMYTSDLTAWLASRVDRVHYLTDAVKDWPGGVNAFELLSRAQYLERLEVFEAVWSFLDSMEPDNG